MQDNDQFADFFDDVTPLEPTDKVPTLHRQLAREQALIRQQAAANSTSKDDDPISEDQEIELVDPMDMLSFQRPGVQHGVFRKLRLGHYDIHMTLDLHRHSVSDARLAVIRFVRQCLKQGERTAIIVHGIGHKSNPQAMLKSCINSWLPQLPNVLAFHSCNKLDGGLGAVYVMLSKSEEAKQKNRERFQQRRRFD
ncbi:DNA endonuclease SmrA [Echinimonas agarilytica]|uniref:DNA endonuclease SmrA n=1 Tax=Echinimonas agarilytica TaxID=1215918 RepID=A0AA41W8N0_9GAMM|nr:DNA endonuclease SmrA [Echinimonas agarilytica]MCM2680507.1 DNA endonuclease SmrA [Echinimonas agarilytica]